MKKRELYEPHLAETRIIWRRFCAILAATERQYASQVMPVLVDLYKRHEKVCGHETDETIARENVAFLYEIHHIDDLGPDLAARARKVIRKFELQYEANEALRKKFRLIKGGRKDNQPATFRSDLKFCESLGPVFGCLDSIRPS
jgi:hypothetical protein